MKNIPLKISREYRLGLITIKGEMEAGKTLNKFLATHRKAAMKSMKAPMKVMKAMKKKVYKYKLPKYAVWKEQLASEIGAEICCRNRPYKFRE